MTALSVAIMTQLMLSPACTVPGMAADFWPAVVKVESRHEPNALHDDTVNRSYYPDTADEAETIARGLMAQGHSIGVGLSQLTGRSEAEFARKFGLTIREALNPCLNMKVGASFYVSAALSVWNTGTTTRGITNGFVGKVQAAYATPPPASPPAVRTAINSRPAPGRFISYGAPR